MHVHVGYIHVHGHGHLTWPGKQTTGLWVTMVVVSSPMVTTCRWATDRVAILNTHMYPRCRQVLGNQVSLNYIQIRPWVVRIGLMWTCILKLEICFSQFLYELHVYRHSGTIGVHMKEV